MLTMSEHGGLTYSSLDERCFQPAGCLRFGDPRATINSRGKRVLFSLSGVPGEGVSPTSGEGAFELTSLVGWPLSAREAFAAAT